MIEAVALATLNHLLAQADWARRRLAPFAGRRAQLVMPPWRLGFTVAEDGSLRAAESGDADVVVTLPADTPFAALEGLDKAMAGAHVVGNAEFATELSFVLRHLRWDAEEDLSRLVGDIAAHRLVQGAGALLGWQRQMARNLGGNVADYAGEELGLLARRSEMDALRAELAELCDKLSQLEKRARVMLV